jgi:PAS domain S-box-containing protein
VKTPDFPTNEAERLKALQALKVLDTPAEARFDRITRVAQRHFNVPITLVSLVDEGRQWFKSCQGLDVLETSRDISFCGHAILKDEILIVSDATKDPFFADNPLVTGAPHIRFYAGTPLHAPGNERVGTLCIIDTQPRELSAEDIAMLRDLADCVEEELVRVLLEESEQRALKAQLDLKTLIDTAVDGIVTMDQRGVIQSFNPAAERLFGYTEDEAIDHNLKLLMPAEFQAELDDFLKNVLTHGIGKANGIGQEVIGKRQDGSTFPVEFSFSEMMVNGERMFTLILRDITERKELQRTQKLYQTILQSSDDAIISKTLDGIITSWNPGAERIFGYRADEAIGQSMALVVPERRMDEEAEILAKIAQNKKVDHFETVRRRKDGSLIDVSVTISPVINKRGNVIGVSKIARDITARKQTDDALQFSSQLVNAIVDTIGDGIITIDEHGIVHLFNKAAEQIFGRTAAQAIGQPLTLLMPLRYRDGHRAGLARMRAGGARRVNSSVEVHGLRADRSEFPLELALTELRTAGKTMFVGSLRDITERQRLWTALADERRRLSDVLEGSNLGAWEWNLQTGALSMDERSAMMIGFDLAELMPVTMETWMSRTHPEDKARVESMMKEHLAAQSDHYQCDVRLQHKDGHWVWLHCSSGLTSRTADGVPLLMSGTYLDITARKDIEAMLLAARAQAEAANTAKTMFLANMSHEIRSPLNAILGLVYLLEQTNLDGDAREMARKIRNSGNMLLGIISDILDMSKIEAGQLNIEQAPFDLETIIDNVATTLGTAIGEKDIELTITPLPAGVRNIVGDATRLQAVMINLVSNAAKFTQAGSIVVGIEPLSREDGSEWLRFSVRDTGIGIPHEQQSAIFEAFVQADESTTRRFGGTGLGLTICSETVKLMGGEIGLVSAPGEGSEFWFTLPLKRVAVEQHSSLDVVKLNLLVVDDCEIALEAIGAVAQQLGWQAHKIDSGASALAWLQGKNRATNPDVVVIDWKMPGMDGLALASSIRANATGGNCAIVIMATAQPLANLTNQADAALIDGFLAKPVTESSLYNAVLQAQQHRIKYQGSAPSDVPDDGLPLSGVRLLVVEDSDINREVAQRILCGLGATVSLAEDGRLGVDWLLAHPFEVDLVLMDVQMPVLDGIEATRLLRRMPQFDDLPIVGLSAGVLASQQQSAMAVGMTEFIRKPFNVPLTVALIQRLRRPSRLLSAKPGTASLNAGSMPSGAPEAASLSKGVMNTEQALGTWLDLPTYQTYLRRFAASYGDGIAQLGALLDAGDRAGAATLVHKISGVAASLSLVDTHSAAQALEALLETQDDPGPVLADFSKAMTAVIAEINRYAPPIEQDKVAIDTPRGSAPPLSADARIALQKQLKQLLLALDSDNPVLIKLTMATLEQQLPPAALGTIMASVLDYDYQAAKAHTRQLAIDHAIELEPKP